MGSQNQAQAGILVADSELEDGQHAVRLLQGAGYPDVRLVGNRRDCVEAAQDREPALILVDIDLGGMNGISLIRKLRDFYRVEGKRYFFEVPVLITAKAISKHYMREACRAGIEGMLRKPYDPDRFVKIIKASLLKPRRFVVLRGYFGPERRSGPDETYSGEQRRVAPKMSEIYSPAPANGVWPFEIADLPDTRPARRTLDKTPIGRLPPKPAVTPKSALPAVVKAETPIVPTGRDLPERPGIKPEVSALPEHDTAETPTDIHTQAEKATPEPSDIVQTGTLRTAPPPAPPPAPAQQHEVREQKEEPGEVPEEEEQELEEIPLRDALEDHKLWVNTGGQEGQQAAFQNADLRNADLEKTDLTHSTLQRADFSGAQCREAVFRKCDLAESKFVEADLQRVNMAVARLSDADFSKANMESANLLGADLTRANFRGASLRGSNFSGANLNGTDLRGVDLSATQGLFVDQITRARISRNTRLPQGIKKR